MKKFQIIALVFFLFISLDSKSQGGEDRGKFPMHEKNKNRDERKEKIESAKIGFITNKLDLTVEQAQKFWPLYNEMQQKLKSIREQSENQNTAKDVNSLSETEVNSLIDERFKQKQNELNIEKEYYQKFKTVIKPEQVLKLVQAENDFKAELMDRIRNRMNKTEGTEKK